MGWASLVVAVVGLSAGCRLHFNAPDDALAETTDAVDAATRNLVFFTTTKLRPVDLAARGGGNVLAGGDSLCAERAAAGGLPGTYVALVSDATTNAIDRLATARGWYRLDGEPFADTATSLFSTQQVFYPVLYDETGTPELTTQVMTGTGGNGVDGNGSDCLHWTSSSMADSVYAGNSTDGTTGWSSRYIPDCSASLHVYCFGIDHAAPIEYKMATGRHAFVSLPWIPGGGLAAADARCQMDASLNGLTGVYRALLATNTTTAASRLPTTGATWVRVDGIPVAATATDLFQRKLVAPLSLMADGATYWGGLVWSGAGDPLVISANQSCSNWTSNSAAQSGHQAIASDGAETFFTEPYSSACNSSYPVYCLEE